MCGRSVKLFKGLVSLCATALLCAIAAISPVSVQAAASYEWKNAQIVGGERNASALE